MTDQPHDLEIPILLHWPMSAGELANAADANCVVHASWVAARASGMRVAQSPELVRVDSGLDCDTFNFVCRARLDPGRVGSWIERAIAFFRDSGRPFSWWVGPGDQPSDLGDRLVAAGLPRAEAELAMAADLDTLRKYNLSPDGLIIRRVETSTMLSQFARLLAANWDPPDLNVLRFYELGTVALLDPACAQWLYLGFLRGEAVATAELTLGGGVAGLYNISTLPPFRRRGIGTAMTVRPLLDARAQGYHVGVLQAAAEGVGAYERVGFKHFGNISEFKPPRR